ncbi:MAG: DUF3791 domain-containing protein [Coriobacteriales bacterium]|nr:DUF3791 domain-containing protein [Coriobacteriales bacterium]
MTYNISHFMVFITEKIAERFFSCNSVTAYQVMRKSGFWEFLLETYDVSHTLSTEYLLKDAAEWFAAKEIAI